MNTQETDRAIRELRLRKAELIWDINNLSEERHRKQQALNKVLKVLAGHEHNRRWTDRQIRLFKWIKKRLLDNGGVFPTRSEMMIAGHSTAVRSLHGGIDPNYTEWKEGAAD